MTQNAYYHLADCFIKLNDKEKAKTAYGAASEFAFNPDIKEDALFSYAKLTYELSRITSYNVCYTKLLRGEVAEELTEYKEFFGGISELAAAHDDADIEDEIMDFILENEHQEKTKYRNNFV